MKTTPVARSLVRATALLAIVLFAAASAEAGIRYRAVRFVPQGAVAADGYDLHLRPVGSAEWTALDLGFLETNDSGIARYRLLLNDDVDYDLAVSAYVMDGEQKLSSPLSNEIMVEATFVAECAVNDDCVDANVCNGAERCVYGLCLAGDALSCADPGPCQAAVCDPVQGCLVVPDPDDPACAPEPDPECASAAECADANVCNGSEQCVEGVCAAGVELTCADPGPCQAAVCDPVQGCLVVPDPDDPACQPEPECLIDSDCGDTNVCNGAEQCVEGFCTSGSGLSCADPGPCQAAVCDAALGCQVVEDPDDPTCQCLSDADCGDGNACNGSEQCLEGVCWAGQELSCADPGPCQAGVCDAVQGCLVVEDPDDPTCECLSDADCGDGDVCNGSELCIAGACWAGDELACPDPGPCQAAVCDPVDGCGIVEDPDDPECEAPGPELVDVSIDLDGQGEQLGTEAPVRLGVATAFTLSMWIKPATLDGEQALLFNAFSPGSDQRYSRIALSVRNDRAGDPFRIVTNSDTGQLMQRRDYGGLQRLGQWQHLVMRQRASGGHVDLFVDGVRASPSSVSSDRTGSMSDREREILIGTDYTRIRRFFDGRIGHVALWDRRLKGDEIAEIHAGGHDIDLRVDQGAYAGAAALRHYWRLGEDLDRLGADSVATDPVHLDQLVGIDDSDVVYDAP